MADINPIDLLALPYVDRKPDPFERPDQRRINWIQNGECLGAAESAIDNSGELNRGPVQVQRNVTVLLQNDNLLNDSIKEVITRVNAHDVVLGQIGDDNLANKVQALEEKVAPLEGGILENKQNIFLAQTDIDELKTAVGTRPADDNTTLDVMNDLLYIKQDVGNFAGKDINGNELPNNPATGIKARLVTQGLGIASNERRIRTLEDEWQQSDVAALQADIDQVRLEIGPTAQKPANKSVYQWIAEAETKHTEIDDKVAGLERVVGSATGDTLDDRITENKTAIGEVRTQSQTNQTNIADINSKLGDVNTPTTIEYRLKITETQAALMYPVVGATEHDGLRKTVSDLEADQTSINNRVTSAENNVTAAQREVATLKTQVGSNVPGSETGLTARIKSMETTVVGADGVSGLKKDVTDLKASVALKIDDVVDTKKYVRTQGSWEELNAGITDAPNDSYKYVRGGQSWFRLGSSDLTMDSGIKFKMKKDTTTTYDVLSVESASGNINVGTTGATLVFRGDVGAFTTNRNFTLNDGINGPYLKNDGTHIEIGQAAFQVKLHKGTGDKDPVVRDGVSDHKIWHEGNFPDNLTSVPKVRVNGAWEDLTSHLPPNDRTRGGFYVKGNSATTNLIKDADTELTISTPIEMFNFNHEIEQVPATSHIRYSGLVRKVLNFTVNGEITCTETTKPTVTVKLIVNDTSTNINYVIHPDMWTGDRAVITINFPYEARAQDVFSLKAVQTSSTTPIDVIATGATMYVMEM